MFTVSIPTDFLDICARLGVAALLGGMVGFERDIHGRSAGLRTHLLVSLGSALFMILSLMMPQLNQPGSIAADPGRIAAQIITGIGFLGAGVIVKQGVTVRGLTTAACLWVAAALGMASAAGLYPVALGVALLTVAVLVGLNVLEQKFRHDTYRELTLHAPLEVELDLILEAVTSCGVTVVSCDFERDLERGVMSARIAVRFMHRGVSIALAQRIYGELQTRDIALTQFAWKR